MNKGCGISVRRLSFAICAFFAILVLLSILSVPYRDKVKSTWHESVKNIYNTLQRPEAPDHPQSAIDIAQALGALLDEHAPTAPEQHTKNVGVISELWPPQEKGTELMDLLHVKPEEITSMRTAHRAFVEAMKEKLPSYIVPKNAESRGIVTVAGGGYLPPLMVSLRMLRRMGTDLPVEVFLANEGEYEEEICERVLPSLNANCLVLTNMTRATNATHKPHIKIEHYQYKIFAILFSSFQNVLWLDSDDFPLHNSSELFDAEPFVSRGLVAWPDLWQTTVSPAYYNISDQKPVPISERASTESGQLLVSKEKHYHSLLLAAYYNYYGPTHYYTLLCQGGAGCGDKGTFLPAAEALDLPFYDVKEPTLAVGHSKGSDRNDIWRYALIQHDPIEDWRRNHGEDPAETSEATANSTIPPVRAYFLHANVPKWDANHALDHVSEYDLSEDNLGHHAPAFRDPPEAVEKIKGVERMMWEEARWSACELKGKIKYWKDPREKNGDPCKELNNYFAEVLDTEVGKGLGLGPPPTRNTSVKSTRLRQLRMVDLDR